MTISIPPLEGEIVTGDDELVRLDRKIDAADADAAEAFRLATMARWEFGRKVLAERKGKQLPHGRMAELCALTGKSKPEISFRVQFAELYPTVEKVSTAVDSFDSWTQIRQSFAPPKPELPPTPPTGEGEPKGEPRQKPEREDEPEDWPADEDLPDLEVDVDGRKFHEWSRRLREVRHDAHILLSQYTDSHVIMAHLLEMEIAGEWFTTTQKEYQNGTEE